MNSILRRRRAMMGKKQGQENVLFSWTATDGLSAFTFDGTATTAPYISGSNLVITANSVKYRKVNTSCLNFTGSFTICVEYNNWSNLANRYSNFRIRSRFIGGENSQLTIIANETGHPYIWRLSIGNNQYDFYSPAIPENGEIKMTWDSSAKQLSVYLNDSFIASVTGTPPSTTDYNILWFEAGGYEVQINVSKILVLEGIH